MSSPNATKLNNMEGSAVSHIKLHSSDSYDFSTQYPGTKLKSSLILKSEVEHSGLNLSNNSFIIGQRNSQKQDFE